MKNYSNNYEKDDAEFSSLASISKAGTEIYKHILKSFMVFFVHDNEPKFTSSDELDERKRGLVEIRRNTPKNE